MSELTMPSFGADMDAGTLIEWRIKPGDSVTKGDIVAVIETMKGAIDMEVFEDGTIEALLVDEGDKVPVGTPIASIATAGAASTEPVAASAVTTAAVATASASALPASAPARAQTPTSGEPRARILASPLARSRAQQYQLDLSGIRGSGPGGALLLADIERKHGAKHPVKPAAARVKPGIDRSAMRQAIAAAMAKSKREIPHYYLASTIDLSETLSWLEARNQARPPEQRVLLGALLIKATAAVLKQVPELNGFYRDGGFQPSGAIHVGMAITIRGAGLVVPALLDADRQPLDALMENLRDVSARARQGGLRSSEMSAATITVTSLGERGVEAVYGVIFPPQVAILGFGSPCTRPWVTKDGGIEARTVMRVTLAADHRVSDGHLGARLLRLLEKQLQAPESL
ncbi:dihydrolipoamide acetyltransferase family protein [Marinobacterium rhizophilum]|uniref:dihydrolipoamide acetyltransferase family protein n=1 Tax=Marinobacterium rhizophilum TaxID=420402 RepID=UPI00036BE643|nr:dihydrolipoamide acetyltransferase family protein [Marinobacterium rhizophilum]